MRDATGVERAVADVEVDDRVVGELGVGGAVAGDRLVVGGDRCGTRRRIAERCGDQLDGLAGGRRVGCRPNRRPERGGDGAEFGVDVGVAVGDDVDDQIRFERGDRFKLSAKPGQTSTSASPTNGNAHGVSSAV